MFFGLPLQLRLPSKLRKVFKDLGVHCGRNSQLRRVTEKVALEPSTQLQGFLASLPKMRHAQYYKRRSASLSDSPNPSFP
jgi:hypothetical protein